MAEALCGDAWQAHPAAEGAKGLRLYDGARIVLPYVVDKGYVRYVLIRRSRSGPTALGYYLVFASVEATLMELAGAAGLRWTIEECFQRAKDRMISASTIAKLAPGMAASSYDAGHGRLRFPGQARRRLAPFGSRQTERKESKSSNRSLTRRSAFIPTVAEIRSLIMRLMMRKLPSRAFVFAWSLWRGRHQAHAMITHYKERAMAPVEH